MIIYCMYSPHGCSLRVAPCPPREPLRLLENAGRNTSLYGFCLKTQALFSEAFQIGVANILDQRLHLRVRRTGHQAHQDDHGKAHGDAKDTR